MSISLKTSLQQVSLPAMERVVHGFLSSVIGAIALVFWLPGHLFSNPTFRVFASVGPEEKWAFWLGGIAAVSATGLIVRNRIWIFLSLIWIASTHGVIATCFYLGITEAQPVTPGVTTYGLIACLGYYLFWCRLKELL